VESQTVRTGRPATTSRKPSSTQAHPTTGTFTSRKEPVPCRTYISSLAPTLHSPELKPIGQQWPLCDPRTEELARHAAELGKARAE
jgi:hypothetical protein